MLPTHRQALATSLGEPPAMLSHSLQNCNWAVVLVLGHEAAPFYTTADRYNLRIKLHVSQLYPVLGGPRLPALREIFIVRLSDELPDDLGF